MTLLSSVVNVRVRSYCPDSSGVEHLHGKQAVVGSIPILGKMGLKKFVC